MSNNKFEIIFSIDDKNNVNIDMTQLTSVSDEDIEKICVLLYSINTGLFYQDIIKQFSTNIINDPETSEQIILLISNLARMGRRKSAPTILPSQVFGRLTNG